MKVTIKTLSECTFEEAVDIWNKSFEGYVVDVSMTLDQFIGRIALEGLSPTLSIVAYVGNEPAGIVLNGVRAVGGKKVSWNGGTGVTPQFRGRGIGTVLMKAVMELYKQEKVELATLEAFKKNEPAISLYLKFGYEIVDHLLFLEHNGPLNNHSFQVDKQYTAIYGSPQAVGSLSFYQHLSPWQTQCTGIRDGQSMIIQNSDRDPIGYSLFKHAYGDEGNITSTVLYQCHIKENVTDPENAIKYMLSEIFSPFHREYRRTTFNFSAANETTVRLLKQAQFSCTAEQVFMTSTLTDGTF